MATLRDYLVQKKQALAERKAAIEAGKLGPAPLKARVSAEGRSGIRRIRIRDHQVITDSFADFAGYDLGPSSPELQLGVLGSCLNHSFLIQAAALGVPVDSLEIEVTGEIDPRASHKEYSHLPVHPQGITYTLHIDSPASDAEIEKLKENVERYCPILNLLKLPQHISGSIARVSGEPARHAAE